jgi:Ca2+-binding RTX toxin-like protein
MSFLPPTGTPFSLVQENPNATSLNNAIQAGITSGAFENAPPGGPQIAPTDKTLIVGGGNDFTVIGIPGDILVTGAGTRLNIIGPADIQGTNLGGGGLIIETVQGEPGSDPGTIPDSSPKRIDFSASYSGPTENLKVDTSELVGGNETYIPLQTILDASGGLATDIVFYAHGGSGDDLLTGSAVSDFLRGGAGDDQINAGAGDDIVRGGSGSDEIQLGSGEDDLYYTIDQIDSEDFIADFTSGEDDVFFDASAIDSSDVEIVGGNTIEVSVDDKFLRIVSGKDDFQQSDIDFI